MKDFVAGSSRNQGSYSSFQPEPIHRPWVIEDMEILQLLGKADRQLGRLDMYSEYIPNVDLFITMHVLKEATQSSRIEGTQTRMEEALLDKEDIPQHRRDDWQEVQNYIEAMNTTIRSLAELPFSSRLIRSAHEMLMQGVRSQHKRPGEFRSSQNWIGGPTIKDAAFVPPVHTSIGQLMNDLESFAHDDRNYMPELIRIAIVHYQFETIHPFLDGNGRVGRLLIPVYLVERGILKRPVLYLSDFLEKNRLAYFNQLERVRLENDIAGWVKFFLTGVSETARLAVGTFDAILKLQKDVENRLEGLGARAASARILIRELYRRPVTDAARVVLAADVSVSTAYRLIRDLENVGVLRESTGAERGRMWVFSEYLNLFAN